MFKKLLKPLFVISVVLASVWKVFIKFYWHGQNTISTGARISQFSVTLNFFLKANYFNDIFEWFLITNLYVFFFWASNCQELKKPFPTENNLNSFLPLLTFNIFLDIPELFRHGFLLRLFIFKLIFVQVKIK